MSGGVDQGKSLPIVLFLMGQVLRILFKEVKTGFPWSFFYTKENLFSFRFTTTKEFANFSAFLEKVRQSMTDFAAKSQLYFWKIVNFFAPQLWVHLYIQGFYNIEISCVFQSMYVIGFDR